MDAEVGPGLPVSGQHLGVDQRRLDVERQRLPLLLGQLRHEVGDHHVEAREHRMARGDAMQLALAHVSDVDAAVAVGDTDAGAVEPDAHVLAVAVELRVVERRQHDVVHGVARRDARHQGAHQEARERRVAVGEMVDVGLVEIRVLAVVGQAETGESGISRFLGVGCRHRVGADAEEIQGAALEAVRDLLAVAADLGDVIAIAGLAPGSRLFRPPISRRGDHSPPHTARSTEICPARRSEIRRRNRAPASRSTNRG